MAQAQTLKLREGAIGAVRHVQASFGFTVASASNIRMVAGLGGGALLDAGSYPVSLVRIVAGARPARAWASAQWFSAGLDKTVTAMLEFPGGMVVQVCCSFATASHRHAMIAGENGAIMTDYSNHAPASGMLSLLVKRRREATAPYETLEVPGGSGFLAEAESFARLMAGGERGVDGGDGGGDHRYHADAGCDHGEHAVRPGGGDCGVMLLPRGVKI